MSITHILTQGESMEQLSARYGVPVCMLIRANRSLFSEGVIRGMELRIPPADMCLGGLRSYTVKDGDTVLSVARASGVTMRSLMLKNGIVSPAGLSEGMLLSLPPRHEIYVAEATDTLASIAEKTASPQRSFRS